MHISRINPTDNQSVAMAMGYNTIYPSISFLDTSHCTIGNDVVEAHAMGLHVTGYLNSSRVAVEVTEQAVRCFDRNYLPSAKVLCCS